MSTRNIFLPYYIVLTDPERVKALQAQYPQGVNRAIANPDPPAVATGGAVIEFSAPFVGYNERIALETTGDHIWTPWYKDGSADDKPFPIDVATFQRKSGGFLGIGGTTRRYYWIGQFVYSGTSAAPANVDPDVTPALVNAPMAQRRWIDGFEMRAAETRATSSHKPTYAAGRRTGGKGFRCFGAGSDSKAVATTLFGGSAAPSGVWTRFRMRWSRAGTGTNIFMKWESSTSASCNYTLSISATGDVILSQTDDNSGVTNILGTLFTMTLGTWYAIDVIPEFNPSAVIGGGAGRFRFYKNRELIADFGLADEGTTGNNAGPGRRSRFFGTFTYGNVTAAAPVLSQVDLDDMVESDIPIGRANTSAWGSGTAYVVGNAVLGSDDHVYRCKVNNTGKNPVSAADRATYWDLYEGLDWLNGSAIVRAHVKGFTASNAWAGDYRGANQPNFFPTNRAVLTSSVNGAVGEVEFDLDRSIDVLKGSIGKVSAIIGMHAFAGGAENASLLYDIGAGATGSVVCALQNGVGATFQTMYRPSGLAAPATITTLYGRVVHAASVLLETVVSMFAMVECIGVFGAEDLKASAYPDGVPTVTDGSVLKQHNAPYWNTPWSFDSVTAAPGPAGVEIIGGTYVGNGTGQDITFRMPPHFFWCRPTTGVRAGGAKWMSTMHFGHQDDNQGYEAMHAIEALEDPTFVAGTGEDAQQNRYMLRISGGNQQSNAVGVTYQYIAVCDPGGRYLINHALQSNQASVTADDTIALPNADFIPEWLWGMIESEDTSAGTAMLYKSSGHAAASVGRMGAAPTALALTFGTGSLRVQQPLYALAAGNTADNIAVSCWRKHDGNADPGEAALWTWGSYTGDGGASRTLTIGTAGKRPLFAVVLGDNNTGTFRDPSHTTTDSELASGGGSTATGITGGSVDGLSVGSAMNTNAVVYHYFVIWGSATAGNGGWSINGEFEPVEADVPADGPWPADPDPSIFDEDTGTGESPALSDESDIDTEDVISNSTINLGGLTGGQVCEVYTRRIVNRALQRIGHSKKIQNLSTETTEAAYQSREAITEDFNQVLREFDWPFATRYADLVLVAGTEDEPAEDDWQYAYRLPNACIKARRIVPQDDTRRMETDAPIEFRLGTDEIGGLIYCNEPATDDVPLVLEYTTRPACPAFFGDALFRDAVAWKHAATLAAALARDSKKADYCLEMYQRALPLASATGANEQQQEPSQDAPWIRDRN